MVVHQFKMMSASEHPKTATTDEFAVKIHKVIIHDRRVKLRQLARIANISIDRLHYVVHDVFSMKKLYKGWIPQ